MGDLTHRAKYGTTVYTDRQAAADELAERMMAFINDAYAGPSLPFTACVTAPSHNCKEFELATYLCRQIAHGFELEDWSALLQNSAPTQSVKTITGGSNRYSLLRESITITPAAVRDPKGGLLFVDDVFETGATARAVCDAIHVHYPHQHFHVLTATRRPAKAWESK